MHKIIPLSVLLFFSLTSQASELKKEFPYIQPISVEVAPKEQETIQKDIELAKEKYTTQEQKIEENLNQEKISHDKYELKIIFAKNSSTLSQAVQEKIQALAQYLKEHKDVQAIIYGYADEEENNPLELAKERANNIVRLLNDYGVKFTRLTAIGTNMQRADSFPSRLSDSDIQLLLIN